MKLLITVLFMLVPAAVGAVENLPFEEDFSSLQCSSQFTLLNEEDSRLPGWKFNNCWELREGGVLYVGSSSGLGSFKTAELNLSGKTRVLLEVKRGGNNDAVFTVDASNGVEFTIDEFKITQDDYCVFTLYILNGVPNTTITISGKEGKFYLTSMKVYDVDNAYDINDAIFYESFDNVRGTGGNDGSFTPDETVITNHDCSLFDNSSGATHQSVHLGNKCIYITSTYYTTPTMNVVSEGQVVLSFRVAGMNNYNYTPNISVSCVNGEISAVSNLSVEHEKWNTYYMKVNTMTPSTQFTFDGVLCFLDEIKVTAVPPYLHESKDNMIYITANKEQEVETLQLIRTLTPDIWCPLCLPFDVTRGMIESSMNATCELCTLFSIDDGVFKFDLSTEPISAGTPFLVRVNKKVENPTFTNVVLRNTPAATAAASTEDYQFVGTYSPIDLETDGSNLFLATDGKLYTPESAPGNRLGGLRAYFVVPATSAPARVMIPEATSNINGSREVSPSNYYELYDLRGQRTNNPNAKGLYIHGGKKVLIP